MMHTPKRLPTPVCLAAALLCTALAPLTFAMTPAMTQDTPPKAAGAVEDPYLWLEDVSGDKAMTWVKEQNSKTQGWLEGTPNFKAIETKTLEIVNSRERIPFVSKRGEFYYNFWQDATHIRGLWRRTSLAEYKKASPVWETVLDLDQLSKTESENWVWKGSNCHYPNYDRCMLSLSRGGGDAVVLREFDIASKQFVKDGFAIAEAKGSVDWIDRDTLYVATAFGGQVTKSGYARTVKLWKRGTPLDKAKIVYEGSESDVWVGANHFEQKGYKSRTIVQRAPSFFTSESFLVAGDKLTKIDVPDHAQIQFFTDQMTVRLRDSWTVGGKTYPQGTLLSINADAFIGGSRSFDILFEPSERRSLSGFSVTKNYLLINEMDNVRNKIIELKRVNGQWERRAVAMPGLGTVGISEVDSDSSDDYFLTFTDFFTPSSLFLAKAGTDQREKLKALPSFFDATPYKAEQFEATSKDGTKIPYFVLMKKDAVLNGTNPTLLYGYGGFEVPSLPNYSGTIGNAWLANGGVYVVANIRGGGEFGPRWHKAALKENRQKAFDDFIGVGEDLVQRKITSAKHLAIYGGSNGGLLVGAVSVQRPDLFKAVVCGVPLLDMKRFHLLLAGNSWMGEYGNPDKPEEWAYISQYSPYQNVRKGVKMPSTFFFTSTKDDRVHPGHARKMMARMTEQGHKVHYYENIEGGHAGSANNKQLAYRTALMYSFLLSELK